VRVMISGAGGFVGHHVFEHLLLTTDYDLIVVDSFRHMGKYDRIREVMEGRGTKQFAQWVARVRTVPHDLRTPFTAQSAERIGPIDAILNIASESHVDRSIEDPVDFVKNNVDLALNMLEYARSLPDLKVFVQMSTDEVYGPVEPGYASREWDAIVPSNPYAASKACQEALAISYWRTYNVPLVLTNTMNIIGERQSPEKFVPMVIRSILRDEPVTVHVSPTGEPGTRHYLHARNQADAMRWILDSDVLHMYDPANDEVQRPQRLNIVGEREVDNLEMVRLIAATMGKEAKIEPVNFHQSRPGHDLRYALDGSETAALGWVPPIPLEESLARAVRWTMENPRWLEF